MLTFIEGVGALLAVIAVFSIISLKCPKGNEAMSGMADAAVCTFLVEAIFRYILGEFAGISFFAKVGEAAGSMSGPAAAILVGISLGTNPIYAAAGGMAVAGFGILPGFLAGYLVHWILEAVSRHVPKSIDTIVLSLAAAAFSYAIVVIVNPGVTFLLNTIAASIEAATKASPILMGCILGGLMKIICTSPMSSMALTAMMGLTGLPMGIAAVACFGGAFSNGVLFRRLNLGERSKAISVTIEPLTQADIISDNPVPVYCSSFAGGALSGMIAAWFNIIDNAPGTASPVPGLLAPFAFNDPKIVCLAMTLALLCGIVSGTAVSSIFLKLRYKPVLPQQVMNFGKNTY
jgi:fructose-specific phosphotransferase system IIC component